MADYCSIYGSSDGDAEEQMMLEKDSLSGLLSPSASSISLSASDGLGYDSDTSAGFAEDKRNQPQDFDVESTIEAIPGYKKVLVTGGAGFIGSSVAEALLLRGDDVVIVDEINDYYSVELKHSNLKRLVNLFGASRCRVYEGDICDVPFITDVFEKEEPEWIVHMAARAGVRPSIDDPFIYIHSNIEGTTRLLELAVRFKCRNFVFASSSSVYGEASRNVFRETDNVDLPVSPYAMSKKACELVGYTYHHLYNLNVAGLRFFTVYGPRGRPDMAPAIFVSNIAQGKEILRYGDGSSSRDYTYISDIVDGVVRSLDRPCGYQIYNLGRGKPVELNTFIGIVESALNKKAHVKVMPMQPGDVSKTCADVSKAQKMLGYAPKVTFEEGIKRTVEWYLSNSIGHVRERKCAADDGVVSISTVKEFALLC